MLVWNEASNLSSALWRQAESSYTVSTPQGRHISYWWPQTSFQENGFLQFHKEKVKVCLKTVSILQCLAEIHRKMWFWSKKSEVIHRNFPSKQKRFNNSWSFATFGVYPKAVRSILPLTKCRLLLPRSSCAPEPCVVMSWSVHRHPAKSLPRRTHVPLYSVFHKKVDCPHRQILSLDKGAVTSPKENALSLVLAKWSWLRRYFCTLQDPPFGQ